METSGNVTPPRGGFSLFRSEEAPAAREPIAQRPSVAEQGSDGTMLGRLLRMRGELDGHLTDITGGFRPWPKGD
ncbi:MAG: hypothetical protein EB084_23440, partial [Proteobacteria bacterium]|nr:hypothetical protein [Pseudomonadota bacterium]